MTATYVSIGVAFVATVVAFLAYRAGRHASQRYQTENKEAEQDRDFRSRMMALEILGLPGNSDYPSLKQRLRRIHDRQVIVEQAVKRVEILAKDSHKELHPNGGSSMRDDIQETRRLAEQAAENARIVANELDARLGHPQPPK